MLLKLSAQISDCMERAHRARERANAATDPIIRDDFLVIEARWLRLAQSYRTSERLQDYLAHTKHWRDGQLLSDTEVEQLAERMIGSSKSKL